MSSDTKERILNSALDIFARDGYAGTNIKDIAEAVGVVKSGFYRHYGSKEEIWNAVLDMMIAYYEEHFGSADKLPSVPKNTDELYELTMRMVNFTVHDDKVIKMRKIILTEQFRDERIRKLATRYFIDDTKAIFEKVFSSMTDTGVIRKTDVGFLAFSYTAPITVLIHLCDREPQMEKEIMRKIKKHIEHFLSVYGSKNTTDDNTAQTFSGMTLLGIL